MTGDIHLIRLECGKANAIDEKLLEMLNHELDDAVASKRKAVVITGYEGFFSAGLNLRQLPDSQEGMASFIERFEETNLKLLSYPLPAVAAVNGHAIAGGCVLACTCDVRVGAEGSYKIGVSEVSLGIVFPASAFEIMRHTIAPAWAPEVLLAGSLLGPEDARAAGILHHLAPPERVLEDAMAHARALGGKPPLPFRHSKLALRAPMLERIEKTKEEARRLFLESWFSPEVVERRNAMLS